MIMMVQNKPNFAIWNCTNVTTDHEKWEEMISWSVRDCEKIHGEFYKEQMYSIRSIISPLTLSSQLSSLVNACEKKTKF